MHAEQHTIPNKINLTVLVVCSMAYCSLLWTAAHVNHFGWVILCGLLFAVIMIPVYSLIHEAEHGIAHSNSYINNLMGRWLSTLFIGPFTFLKHCHLMHHKKNRTDEEMWDLYYEHQSKLKRYGNLYGMMIGLGYFSIWLAVLLYAIAPGIIFTRFFAAHKEVAGFLKGSDRADKITHSRWESWVVIIFQIAMFYILQLNWAAYLTLFAIHGFAWSSQNYVNHAFSPRDIINGAHNLTVPFWLKWIYLNFNIHLVHHQHPKIPWIYLPKYLKPNKASISFLRNYFRLWKGPRITKEPPPVAPDLANRLGQ